MNKEIKETVGTMRMIHNEYNRLWRESHREICRESANNWARNHRVKVRETTRNWRLNNIEHNKKYMDERRLINRAIAEAIIGSECIICGEDKRVEFHEVDNEIHPYTGNSIYYLNHTSDFIPLCSKHHRRIHKFKGVIQIG